MTQDYFRGVKETSYFPRPLKLSAQLGPALLRSLLALLIKWEEFSN